MKLFWNN